MYGKLINGTITYQEHNYIVIGGNVYITPGPEIWASQGYYPVEDIAEDGTDQLVDGVIKHYIGARTLAKAKAEKIAEIVAQLTSSYQEEINDLTTIEDVDAYSITQENQETQEAS